MWCHRWTNGWWSQSSQTWWSSGDAWRGQHGQGGQWQWGHGGNHADDPMAIVLPNDDANEGADADEQAVQHVQSQKDEFWVSEEGVRVRTAKPSPFEVHQLTQHVWEGDMMSHVNRVLAAFGQQRSAGKASRALLQAQMAEHKWQPGEVVSHRSVAFTICKHMMLQGWKGCCAPSSGTGVGTSDLCFCFPQTSLMPMGCKHNKVPLTSPRVKETYHVTLCFSCSTCIRCGGQLVKSTWYVTIVAVSSLFALKLGVAKIPCFHFKHQPPLFWASEALQDKCQCVHHQAHVQLPQASSLHLWPWFSVWRVGAFGFLRCCNLLATVTALPWHMESQTFSLVTA